MKQDHILEHNIYGPVTGKDYNYKREYTTLKTVEDFHRQFRFDRIYLSGPMTGKPDLNEWAFRDLEYLIRFDYRYTGDIVNPHTIQKALSAGGRPVTIPELMEEDLYQLLQCKVMIMLPGWEKSKGAQLERQIARFLGMKIYYLGDGQLYDNIRQGTKEGDDMEQQERDSTAEAKG